MVVVRACLLLTWVRPLILVATWCSLPLPLRTVAWVRARVTLVRPLSLVLTRLVLVIVPDLVTLVLPIIAVTRCCLTEPRQLIRLEMSRTPRALKRRFSPVRLTCMLSVTCLVNLSWLLPSRLGARAVIILCRPFLRALCVICETLLWFCFKKCLTVPFMTALLCVTPMPVTVRTLSGALFPVQVPAILTGMGTAAKLTTCIALKTGT